MSDGQLSLTTGNDTLLNAGDAIDPRTLDEVVARAQAISRALVAGQANATVHDFLVNRARETGLD